MSPRKPLTPEQKAEVAELERAGRREHPESWQPEWETWQLREWAYEHGMPSSGPDS
jgi:hypothetical protein